MLLAFSQCFVFKIDKIIDKSREIIKVNIICINVFVVYRIFIAFFCADAPVEEKYESNENIALDDVGVDDVAGDSSYIIAPSGRKWFSDPVITPTSRVQSSNIFRPAGAIGPNVTLKYVSLICIFNRIFNHRVKNEIIKWTTEKAVSVFDRCNQDRQRQRTWQPITMSELDAYLGILLYIGVLRDGHRRLRTIWNVIEGHT